ncbi:MAG TPA: hypothetical protein VKG44_06190 [Candidatus Baltobacteraceae bacterium]|nr:hypothetical protein [Candidatus Baltobacteraceae bacterium]
MNWEALTAISTAFTGLVILLTVIFAARQVGALNEQSRALADQLEHLRRATQLDGTLAVFEELFSAELVAASGFVMNEYEERMKDETFRAEALKRSPDLATHKELLILRHMERIGTLIKNDLLDADVLLDFASGFIQDHWKRLKPLALEQRRTFGVQRLWENFEYLAAEAERADARLAAARKAAKG